MVKQVYANDAALPETPLLKSLTVRMFSAGLSRGNILKKGMVKGNEEIL
jgi:hypothetical protein